MPFTTSMKQGLAAAVLAALPLAHTQGTTPPKLTAACNDVAIFMARGNDAPYHDGRTTPFIDATCQKFEAQGNSCDYMDVVFDATLGVEFCPTIVEGAVNGIKQITEYNAQCPGTLIVLNGYSQGAMVSGALLSGGGADACSVDDQTLGLDSTSQAGQALKAALLWGDVKHTANQPYNVLDGADKQAWPRTGANLERLNRYSSVLRSYCAAGDPVCANGDDVSQHLNYFELYTDEASTWVVNKLTPLLSKPSSSAAPPSTATPTAAPETSSAAVTSIENSSTIVIPETTFTITSDLESSTVAKPTTMVSSYIPVTTASANGTSTTSTDDLATGYPVTVVPSSSKYYGNSTVPASSSMMTSEKPSETPYLPVEPSRAATTTKAPEYPVEPAACPPATIYETVTLVVYEYI
ncbi:carbohydrate esterase family 5 protein [Stemphylium lycopersici]|nr:carbohydrate esterase family 5 protein [Stemphylium lycopersici]RAR00208.1 carbohydrate esterase family 5 protein [Stemphylium lycopersici]